MLIWSFHTTHAKTIAINMGWDVCIYSCWKHSDLTAWINIKAFVMQKGNATLWFFYQLDYKFTYFINNSSQTKLFDIEPYFLLAWNDWE